MLFNSFSFIFVFVPITYVFYFYFGKNKNKRFALIWLFVCSLFYYGWWNPIYLFLILSSMFTNYFLGNELHNKEKNLKSKILLSFGVSLNLLLLGYFKYANFFIDTINSFLKNSIFLNEIILPLGISFFTFEQIAFLVDSYNSETKKYNIWEYLTFVTFFPQLIAGPIAHHSEVIPQLKNNSIYKLNFAQISSGITIFFMGLFKKVLIADNLSTIASPIFNSAELGIDLTFLEAWVGALAYSFQIYFDFSGYSDMAVGLAAMIGIKLPYNFNSPYKAKNIIDFWRRWHMTLSRFLKEYLYIPLGGNRNGTFSRYKNLITTMLLGGLWHGAGWNFVIWGFLHGIYLIINNVWISIKKKIGLNFKKNSFQGFLSNALTLSSVLIAWVFFRAVTFNGAKTILKGMIGKNGIVLPESYANKLPFFKILAEKIDIEFNYLNHQPSMIQLILIFILFFFVKFLPNSQEIVYKYGNYKSRFFSWEVSYIWLIFLVFIAFISLLNLSRVSEFLYYQF